MDEVTQQNAALVEQAAAAASSLEDQARRLTAAVAVFRTDSAAADGRVRPAAGNVRAGARRADPVAA
jgi:methyl-accepting chemotaxis protein-1 (serine sensor receptor)